jgi:transcriptional regulatory protein RtcR
MSRKTVLVGLLGSVLDSRQGAERWEFWRPSVAIGQHEDLKIDRYELLYEEKFQRLAETVAGDIRTVSPETDLRTHPIRLADPWDFEEVYGVLPDFAANYPFDSDHEDYLLNITTGTHAAQICLFLLAEARYFPARLVQQAPASRGKRTGEPGTYRVIDLDLSKYDRLAARFQRERTEGLSFLKSGIETRNERFNLLMERIEHVAIHSADPILLTGPTGAGKSQLARRIYALKKQRLLERRISHQDSTARILTANAEKQPPRGSVRSHSHT